MERGLEKTMDDIMQCSGVKGVMFTDKHGLCLGVRGNGSNFNAGGLGCFASAAAKLDPDNKTPQLILLEAPNRQCLIQQRGQLTGAICKVNSPPGTPMI